MTLAGIISAPALRSEFDAERASLELRFRSGDFLTQEHFHVANLTTATVLSSRTGVFRLGSDASLDVLGVSVFHGGIADVVKVAVAQVEDLEEYTLGREWSTSLTLSGVAGTDHSRASFTPTSSHRLTLRAGVNYKMTLSLVGGGTATLAQCFALLRGQRRIR